MSVGETLAAARSRAGLSVDELSERTKIRETVIRCIEQDDYGVCGGDVFVHGYVRALAFAVGIDAKPLIREYDRAHADTSDDTFEHVARVADPVPPADPGGTAADVPFAVLDPHLDLDLDRTSADLPVVHADPADTVFDLPVVSEDPTPTVADLPVIPAEPSGPSGPSGPFEPAGALEALWAPPAAASPRPSRPAHPPRPSRPPRPPRASHRNRSQDGRRDRRRVAVLAALALAVAGVATGLALSSQPAPAGKNAAAVSHPSAHAASAAPVTSSPAAPATAAPTTPAQAKPPVASTSLPIASAAAFGPGGLADGDNARIASYAITRGAPAPWQSQWYATAQFGNLKQGTGLLLDLGRTATVTSVRLDLASYTGANLQLRVGDSAGALSSLRVAAVADDVGGTVRLRFRAPPRARYVLIWFTLLPPNGAGQYQASVYHVVVNGRPLAAAMGAGTTDKTSAWAG